MAPKETKEKGSVMAKNDRRLECIDRAIRLAEIPAGMGNDHRTADNIVDDAKKFEAFVKGDDA